MMSLFASWWIAALFWFQKCISSITGLCSDFSPCNLKSSKMHWVKRAPQHFSWTCRLREVQIFYTCYKCIAKFYLVWMKRPRACWRVTLIYSSNIRSLQAVYMILVKQAWWQQLQQIKDKLSWECKIKRGNIWWKDIINCSVNCGKGNSATPTK